jgi:predicted GH43/DUF377 family glycosyl hydrolase
MSSPLPTVERLHGGAPIVSRNEAHAWENKVTFNPACAFVKSAATQRAAVSAVPCAPDVRKWLADQPALAALLYRAQGKKTDDYDHTRSSIGLALCTPHLDVLFRHDEPVILPDAWYDNLGVEDPRITQVGDQFIMIYTGYASAPGGNRVRVCMASSEDLVHWKKHGPVQGNLNDLNNKNGMLFDPVPGQKLLMLHRPMEGENPMMVHWAEADSLHGEWKSRGVLMPWVTNPRFRDVWIGGGAPPLLLPDGRYLMLYHIGNRDAAGNREYDLGIALCDPRNADKPIVKRNELLLRPGTPAETTGDAELGVNNVVFVCGAYWWEDDLYFPYAGADSCVLAARIRRSELDRWIG